MNAVPGVQHLSKWRIPLFRLSITRLSRMIWGITCGLFGLVQRILDLHDTRCLKLRMDDEMTARVCIQQSGICKTKAIID